MDATDKRGRQNTRAPFLRGGSNVPPRPAPPHAAGAAPVISPRQSRASSPQLWARFGPPELDGVLRGADASPHRSCNLFQDGRGPGRALLPRAQLPLQRRQRQRAHLPPRRAAPRRVTSGPRWAQRLLGAAWRGGGGRDQLGRDGAGVAGVGDARVLEGEVEDGARGALGRAVCAAAVEQPGVEHPHRALPPIAPRRAWPPTSRPTPVRKTAARVPAGR
jgi:hypothetical protein